MICRNMVLTNNYKDLISFAATKLEEPMKKQYLKRCPKNVNYFNNTSAESLVDPMNFYFETKIVKKNQAFLYFPAHEGETSLYKNALQCSLKR